MNTHDVIEIILGYRHQLPGLVDILIRGSLNHHQPITTGWSDIDTSLIFEEVNASVLLAVNELKQEVKMIFPYKFTTTVVSREDFYKQLHHHGIKPLAYSHSLEPYRSLMGFDYKLERHLPPHLYQLDLTANIAYLIHDLRIQYTNLDLSNTQATEQFYKHAARRSIHLLNNIELALQNTSWDPERLITIKQAIQRHQNPKLASQPQTSEQLCSDLLDLCEQAHHYYIHFVDEILKAFGSQYENN